MAKAIARNPFAGETRLDLGRLTPSEIASLDFTVSVGDGPSRADSALKVHSGSGKGLAALGRLVTNPAYAPERKTVETVADALVDLPQRNASAAPIRSEMEAKDD